MAFNVPSVLFPVKVRHNLNMSGLIIAISTALLCYGVFLAESRIAVNSSAVEWQPAKIDEAFDVTLQGMPRNNLREPGSCAKWSEKIREAYEDAMTMIEMAMLAARDLSKTEESSLDHNDTLRLEYARKSQAMSML